MRQKDHFFAAVCSLAVPAALQSMLQSSFSIVDQIMIGQLGSVSVAGVGLAGKFTSIFSVVVAAFGSAAGIMISQYLGQKNSSEVRRSFRLNLGLALGFAGIFSLLSLLLPRQIMGLYTTDEETLTAAKDYLVIIAGTFFPVAAATILATLFRCMEKASWPLYASIFAALSNTFLNYILIFGKFGLEPMGATGAAIATVISQFLNFLMMLVMYAKLRHTPQLRGDTRSGRGGFHWAQYGTILFPILVCEFFWSLGENVYASIYGHLGTEACAAMTLTNPVQGLMIGALCGLSQAAAVLIGKQLGNGDHEQAYRTSKKLMLYGLAGSVILSALIILTSSAYVEIYRVEEAVKDTARQILVAYALVAAFKIQNMIMGGGILRSGGQTKYVMYIDLIGTWIFGVPLGLVTAYIFHLPIPWVYFILSLEEGIRFLISLAVFRRRKWMTRLEAAE